MPKGAVDAGEQGLQPAMRAIVLDALAKGEGSTLAKNSALRDAGGFSAGTVQRALDALAERGAVQVVSRGHLGRRIEAINVGACWQAAGLLPLRLVLSPAGAVEMDVLESALTEELTGLGVPHTVQHLRGGAARLQAVHAGEHHLTVVSSGTFDGMRAAKRLELDGPLRVLDEGTYYAPDRLVVVRRSAEEAHSCPMTVAIDRESFDHEALTEAEFQHEDGLSYIEVPFPEVPAYVLAGAADAGIWHVTRSPIPPELAGLHITPLARPEALTVRNRLSRAAIFGWEGRPEVRSVLDALALDQLEKEQRSGFDEEYHRARKLRLAQRDVFTT